MQFKSWMTLTAMFFVAACSKSSSTATGSMKMAMKAVNYGAARTGLAGTNTNNGITAHSEAMSILSAAPEAMKVYLQSVSGVSGGASSTVFWSSTASNTTASGYTVTGCPITLTNGNLNLDACAGLSTMSVPEGSYTGLVLKFAEPADIKGCLRAKYKNVAAAVPTAGTLTYPSPFPSTVFNYTTEGVINGTTYTYCTRSDQSYFRAETASNTAIGTNASYYPGDAHFASLTGPELVTISLASGNQQNKTMAQLIAGSVDVSAAAAFTVTAGGTAPTITLAVDLNRMLEFFANTRTDFNPPNPAMHSGTSYFFTTRFQAVGAGTAVAAVKAFAGEVGSVQGYQLIAPTQDVAAWMTVYLDGSGNYLGAIVYVDDDNNLTIMKGNATLTSGTLAAGATLTLDIAGVLSGFTTLSTVGASGTATLNWTRGTGTVNYQRLL